MRTSIGSLGKRAAVVSGMLLAMLSVRPASAQDADPLLPVLRRMNHYFHLHEVDGVTLDSRYALSPTEVARLSAVSQLLGYAEMYRVSPRPAFLTDIVERADFLVGRYAEISSHTAFDGMLGYSMLEAYEATLDSRYLAMGKLTVDELLALPDQETILNGGLMAALALAKYHQLTGDPTAEQRAHQIIASLPPYQHVDGSFPHWCPCSKDIHYTGWMAMELILIRRMLDDALIEPMLAKMNEFLNGRIDDRGVTHYEEPCNDYPGCTVYYYSIATGCGIDYDTRAFTNELGYNALLLDHFGMPKYLPVMRFLDQLETHGTFGDKWDFWPTPDDPYYPWTISDTSVVNMSVLFWSLSSMLSGRHGAREALEASGPVDEVAQDASVDRPPHPRSAPSVAAASARRRLPANEGGQGGPLWTAVDRLLIAGVRPAYCDEPSRMPREVRAAPAGPASPAIGLATEARRGAVGPGATLRIESSSSGDPRLELELPAAARVSLAIHDVAGRRLRVLFTGSLDAGRHGWSWDRRDDSGREVPPGIFYAQLRAGNILRGSRVLVMR